MELRKTRAEKLPQKGQVEQYFLSHTQMVKWTLSKQNVVKLTHGDLWIWHHATLLFQWDFTDFTIWGKLTFSYRFFVVKCLNMLRKNIYESMLFLNYGVTHVLSVAVYIYLFLYGVMHCWKADCTYFKELNFIFLFNTKVHMNFKWFSNQFWTHTYVSTVHSRLIMLLH